jgi:dimethylargininase
MLIALTRAVPASIADCQLTHIDRVPIDVAVARAQHEEYERALESLGCTIVRVATADELPDSVFVEDIAVVTDETAVITRPGAESRRAETAGVVEVLRRYRELRFIEAPGTIDGGDVLRIGDRVFAGLSSRTNREGIRQLGRQRSTDRSSRRAAFEIGSDADRRKHGAHQSRLGRRLRRLRANRSASR